MSIFVPSIWSLLLTVSQSGQNWKLVIVLYEPGSVFDQEVRTNLTEGVPIVAERVHFETAYSFSPYLQDASEGNSTVEALSAGTS